jgi:hypothetical protein
VGGTDLAESAQGYADVHAGFRKQLGAQLGEDVTPRSVLGNRFDVLDQFSSVLPRVGRVLPEAPEPRQRVQALRDRGLGLLGRVQVHHRLLQQPMHRA